MADDLLGLPDEIIGHVLAFCNVSRLGMCATVCQALRQLRTDGLWLAHCKASFPSTDWTALSPSRWAVRDGSSQVSSFSTFEEMYRYQLDLEKRWGSCEKNPKQALAPVQSIYGLHQAWVSEASTLSKVAAQRLQESVPADIAAKGPLLPVCTCGFDGVVLLCGLSGTGQGGSAASLSMIQGLERPQSFDQSEVWMAMHADDAWCVVGSDSGAVHAWAWDDVKWSPRMGSSIDWTDARHKFNLNHGAVWSITMGSSYARAGLGSSEQTGQAICSSSDGTLSVFDLTGERPREAAAINIGTFCFNMCATSSTTVAGAADDGRVHVCDWNAGKTLLRLEGHTRSVHSVVCNARYNHSGQPQVLFSGSRDKTIRVWDTRCSQRCVGVLHGHKGSVTSLELDGDWRLYSASGYIRDASGEVVGVDNAFRVWDVRMLAPLLSDSALPLWPTDGEPHAFDEAVYGAEASRLRAPHKSFTPAQFDADAAGAGPEPVLSVHMASDDILVSTHADTTLRLWHAVE